MSNAYIYIRDLIKKQLEKLRVPMTAELEEKYTVECAGRALRYEKIFLVSIIICQLYNIVYTLSYTQFKLHTAASRVYFTLYTALLIVCIASLIIASQLKKRLPDSARATMALQTALGIVLLFWGAGVAVYDQRVSENLSVYLVVAFSVSVLIFFKPLTAVLTFLSAQIFLFALIPVFNGTEHDCYGRFVNLSLMTVTCILISLYRSRYERELFLSRQIVIQNNAYLDRLARIDALTQINNRRFLNAEVGDIYESGRSEKTPVTFMMMDIDFFKRYNDTFGHLQGDECLRRVAWIIKNDLNDGSEHLVRYGGEEFLYVGKGIDKQTAKQRGEHFNRLVRELVIGPSDQNPMGVTISIGTYTADGQGYAVLSGWEECISKADEALYRAKNSGKDKCVQAE